MFKLISYVVIGSLRVEILQACLCSFWNLYKSLSTVYKIRNIKLEKKDKLLGFSLSCFCFSAVDFTLGGVFLILQSSLKFARDD